MKQTNEKRKETKSKTDAPAPKREGVSWSWIGKNILAALIFLWMLDKLVIGVQPGYNWAYTMLQGNLEVTQRYAETSTDERFEMKLGASHVYLRHIKENTPEDAVILLPSRADFFPEEGEQLFQGEPYNKLWATRFLYPRRVILPQELGETPWSEKITHVAIVNGQGYEYLDYEVARKAPHAVYPIHLNQ